MKRYLLIACFLLMVPRAVYATPPSAVNLSYDEEKGALLIEVKHITSNMHKHFIRKIIVYKNDKEVKSFYYTFQLSPEGTEEEFPLDVVSEDQIKVKVICKMGGSKEAILVIPSEP